MTRIRGFLGEQSFEITDGREIVERYCEATVYGAVYRSALEHNYNEKEARAQADAAIVSFRKTRQ